MWHGRSVEIGSLLTRDRQRKLGAFVVVLAAHVGVFALMARSHGVEPAPITPPFEVQLFRLPPPPPPPPPPAEPAERAGGGAPAAPSRIHVPPPPPPETPPELPAPIVPAPAPAIVVGVSPIDSATPGMGQGGQGTGTGTGTGAGSGPGSGSTRARPIRFPSPAEKRSIHPRAARDRGGRGVIACRIRLDTRLEACRIVEESPPGLGFGQAALAAAAFHRFTPPTLNGVPQDGYEMTIGVDFPGR